MGIETDTAIREEMTLLARSLFERGLTPGSSGNLSARTGDGGFLMTPTNASLGFLDPARLSKLDSAGVHISGDKPTKESFLHLAMYRARPQAKGITHLHSTWCVCLSCLKDTDDDNMLRPLTPYVAMRVGTVAAVPYATPGDDSIAPLIEEKARKHGGIIIRNHGPVVAGKSLRDSVFAMEEVEEAAKIAMLTRNLAVNELGVDELSALEEKRI